MQSLFYQSCTKATKRKAFPMLFATASLICMSPIIAIICGAHRPIFSVIGLGSGSESVATLGGILAAFPLAIVSLWQSSGWCYLGGIALVVAAVPAAIILWDVFGPGA